MRRRNWRQGIKGRALRLEQRLDREGRVRDVVATSAVRVGRRLDRRFHIDLDYPPTASYRLRWGHGEASHARLRALLAAHEEAYRRAQDVILGFEEDLARIDRRERDGLEPCWLNAWLPGLDGAAIYSFVRSRSPRLYLEVGSGMSTRFCARARRDAGLSTRIVSIDPAPRSVVDPLCDEVIRRPLEEADLSVFSALGAGDVVFMDGSHRVFTNSDATTFFLDVLPELAPGVLVGIHDVFLPDDYLPHFLEWHYSEQYLLAAFLLGGGDRTRPVLPSWYVGEHPELSGRMAPMWDRLGLDRLERRGFAFWMQTGSGGLSAPPRAQAGAGIC